MESTRNGGSPEDVLVGGQAVIEGVMMRTPHACAVAVRRADGTIESRTEGVRRLSDYGRPLAWPVLRGFGVLVQSLALGIRCLNYSAGIAMQDAERAAGREVAAARGGRREGALVLISLAVAAAAAVFLFVLAPLWITSGLKAHFTALHNWLIFNLIDGLIRVAFFLGYLLLISRLKDIERVFQYHGAEHKVVHAWEAGEELTVERARARSRLHPRCGTSFLLFVMVVSIVVFSLVKLDAFWAVFLSRLLLIPAIAGLSYELIRLSAQRCRSGFFRLVVLPGLMLQRVTTREPDDGQLEVAVYSLRAALKFDAARTSQAAA